MSGSEANSHSCCLHHHRPLAKPRHLAGGWRRVNPGKLGTALPNTGGDGGGCCFIGLKCQGRGGTGSWDTRQARWGVTVWQTWTLSVPPLLTRFSIKLVKKSKSFLWIPFHSLFLVHCFLLQFTNRWCDIPLIPYAQTYSCIKTMAERSKLE